MLRSHDALEREAQNIQSVSSRSSGHGALSVSKMLDGAQSIGGTSDVIRTQLCELSEQLEGLLEGPAQDLVKDAQRVLQTMVCRIAVIGQVKAGKSSLINALIRQPGLLPSDVNPWTTAVTRLHFKQRAEQREIAAEFRFFDADEWHQLAEGGGRIRELTERLVPGFEAGQLLQQLQAMRQRAAARLGSEFAELLGTSHAFEKFDRSTLEAYVCAGEWSSPLSAEGPVGRYSDITKSAHLYLGGSAFGFPTTLIDTPGTNDPLLVRDEITRRSMDAADVYIVVLTARQALSTDDLALLRILRGLRKERIIVFVNRIDELGNLDSELDAVQTQIGQGLGREFLGFDVPIIYGSARWANQALASEAGDGELESSSALTSFSERNAVVEEARDARELLFKCSGISQLGRVLDRAVQQSHPIQVIRHLSKSFSELSRLNVLTTRDELRLLESSIEAAMHSASSKEHKMRDISNELDRLQTLADALEKSAGEIQTTLVSTAKSEMDLLEAALQKVVDEFTESEGHRLEDAVRDGSRTVVWQCDTVPLRQRLEGEFSRQMRYCETRILAAEANILPILQKVIDDALPDHLAGRRLELSPAPIQPPSISALGRIVALDLGAPWWKAWWTSRRVGEELRKELDRLIQLEFAPITLDLARSARTQITAQISETVRQTRAICLSIVEQLHRQSERQIARMTDLGPGALATDLHANSVRRFAELDERLKTWTEISTRLDALRTASVGIHGSQEFRP